MSPVGVDVLEGGDKRPARPHDGDGGGGSPWHTVAHQQYVLYNQQYVPNTLSSSVRKPQTVYKHEPIRVLAYALLWYIRSHVDDIVACDGDGAPWHSQRMFQAQHEHST